MKDFYNDFDPSAVTAKDREEYSEFLKSLETWEKTALNAEPNIYVFDFENVGGLVMPIILEVEYDNGDTEEIRIPAEIWRYDDRRVSKMLLAPHEIVRLTVDPHREMADVDLSNNSWPAKPVKNRFQLFKETLENNAMQDAAEEQDGER